MFHMLTLAFMIWNTRGSLNVTLRVSGHGTKIMLDIKYRNILMRLSIAELLLKIDIALIPF